MSEEMEIKMKKNFAKAVVEKVLEAEKAEEKKIVTPANHKEYFLKAISRQQNAMSMADTKMRLLEKALDDGSGETHIFDFSISNICFDATFDIVCLLFPNIKPEVLNDYLSWYLYEVPGMDNPYIEVNDEKGNPKKRFEISTPETLYDFLEQYDKTE